MHYMTVHLQHQRRLLLPSGVQLALLTRWDLASAKALLQILVRCESQSRLVLGDYVVGVVVVAAVAVAFPYPASFACLYAQAADLRVDLHTAFALEGVLPADRLTKSTTAALLDHPD